MTHSLAIACDCGALRGLAGDLSPGAGARLICHCKACRGNAERLGKTDALDAEAGVDIFQTSQGRISFSRGADQLACGKISPKGPLRWYARCCNTPLTSTLDGPGLPVAGLITGALRPGPDQSLDDILGPVRFRVFGKFAVGGPVRPRDGESGIAGLMLRFIPMMIGARWRGDHRRSPFFDAATGRPVSAPAPLPDEAR